VFRTLPTVVVFAAVLVAGAVPGLWTGRWEPSTDLDAAAARMAQIPKVVGDWEGRDQALNPRELAAAQATGMLRRQYVHRKTRATVSLLLVCGRPGPVAVHTPDVCYLGSGFEEEGKESREKPVPPGDRGDQFIVRRFGKPVAAVPVHLRIFYGWSADGAWQAPENPRLAYARQPVLYKLYAVRELARADEPAADDPAQEFLGALLPVARPALFPAAGG
jgi:hypothetical protein